MSAPRTAAGRDYDHLWGSKVDRLEHRKRILAIEAEAAGGLRAALERIDRDGCQNFYGGTRCWEAGRARDALYGADKWCDACVAHAAIEKPL